MNINLDCNLFLHLLRIHVFIYFLQDCTSTNSVAIYSALSFARKGPTIIDKKSTYFNNYLILTFKEICSLHALSLGCHSLEEVY